MFELVAGIRELATGSRELETGSWKPGWRAGARNRNWKLGRQADAILQRGGGIARTEPEDSVRTWETSWYRLVR